MQSRITVILILSLLTAGTLARAQDIGTYEARFHPVGSDTLPYRISYPVNFSPEGSYPVIFFLHGSGERGKDNIKQLVHGSRLLDTSTVRNIHEAIVIIPQCPESSYWSNVLISYHKSGERDFSFPMDQNPTVAMTLLLDLVDSVISRSYINRKMIYAGGLSMGGMGTFELVARRPGIFAAAFPICGGANPATVSKYDTRTKFWIFHGLEDNVVPSRLSEEMAAALVKNGIDVKITLYEGVGHNSWDSAFAEPNLLLWLFSKEIKN